MPRSESHGRRPWKHNPIASVAVRAVKGFVKIGSPDGRLSALAIETFSIVCLVALFVFPAQLPCC